MKVLVACEFSGIVREAFKARGHDAWSCDLLPTEIPGNHIQDDVLKHLDEGWDMMIAHPPCTHLANAGGRWFPEKRRDGRQKDAIIFIAKLFSAPIEKIVIENPVGILCSDYIQKHFPELLPELNKVGLPRKPDQVIQPFYFGDSKRKYTCLWLKNIHPLVWDKQDNLFIKSSFVDPEEPIRTIVRKGKYRNGTLRKLYWYDSISGADHGKKKSITFPGIAKAMADQWG